MKLWVAIILAIAVFGGICGAQEKKQAVMLSVDDARRLVEAALPESTRRFPGFAVALDHMHDPAYPQYYLFSVTWDGNPGGSMVIGNYDVDPGTGDVWSATACEEEKTAELVRLQAKMRVRIGLSSVAYNKIRVPGPYCS